MTTSNREPSRRRPVRRLILIGAVAVLLVGGMASWVATFSVNEHPLDKLRVAWEHNRRALDQYRRTWDDKRRSWEQRRRDEDQAHRQAKRPAPDAAPNPAEEPPSQKQ